MIRVGLALSLLLAVAPRAGAQHPLPVFGDSVVVTATGEPVPADEAVAATTVIRREEIAASGVADVGELLRRVEGAVLLRSGLDNGVTSFFVRGAGAAQTLVLLDGVRLNSPFFGGYDWSIPLTAGIERVEVVRGPYSALYGADAVGGVVQLFSERGGSDTLRLALEAGPDGWRRGELAANVTSGRWGVRAAGGARAGSGPLDHDDFTSRVGTADVGYELESGAGSACWCGARRAGLRFLLRSHDHAEPCHRGGRDPGGRCRSGCPSAPPPTSRRRSPTSSGRCRSATPTTPAGSPRRTPTPTATRAGSCCGGARAATASPWAASCVATR